MADSHTLPKQRRLLEFFGSPEKEFRPPQPARKEKYDKCKRKREFVPSWMVSFDGLQNTDKGMICDVCVAFPGLSDKNSAFITGCTSYRIESIRSHWQSTPHARAFAAQKRKNGTVTEGPMDNIIRELNQSNLEVMAHVFNTAYFILKRELAFALYPDLLQLQGKNMCDVNRILSYKSDQACRRFTPYIADTLREPVLERLRNAHAFSIMFDGATDVSVQELELMYIRILEDGVPRNHYVNIKELEHANADGVFQVLNSTFTELVGNDWRMKLVGAGCDGAAVNLGARNSVATRLQENHEHVQAVHCVAHRLELSVLSAIKDNELLKTVQDMLKKIYKHYHYSPKALREYHSLADILEEDCLKPARLGGTRWVPHVRRALKILVDSYSVFLKHFEHGSQTKATPEVTGRALFISKKLKDFRILHFMFFLLDVLEVISSLSLKFQTDNTTAADVLVALETTNLELVALSKTPGDYQQSFLKTLEENGDKYKYKGIQLTNATPQLTTEQALSFSNIANNIMDHINSRIEGSQGFAILQCCLITDMKQWPHTRDELAEFGNESVRSIVDTFKPLLTNMGCDFEKVKQEWMILKGHFGQQLRSLGTNTSVCSLETVFQTDLRFRFSNILMIIEICLLIPVSSSACERGFSTLKRIKTDWRSNLATPMVDNLMFVTIEGPSVLDYKPEPAVHSWWTNSQRRRRPVILEQAIDTQDDDDPFLNFLTLTQPSEP